MILIERLEGLTIQPYSRAVGGFNVEGQSLVVSLHFSPSG